MQSFIYRRFIYFHVHDEESHHEAELFKNAGALIIRQFYARIFNETGMNNEGSSHYQLIFEMDTRDFKMSHLISDSEMISFF